MSLSKSTTRSAKLSRSLGNTIESALPVVDEDGKLLGVVTIDDVIDLAEESATADMQKLGGLEALNEPYDTTPLLTMIRKRAVWLVVLFLGEMLAEPKSTNAIGMQIVS